MAPSMTEEKQKALNEAKEKVRAGYGENKQITDGDYDKSIADGYTLKDRKNEGGNR